MKTKITTLATILCFAILFIGYSKNSDAESTSKLKLEQTQISIVAGKTQQCLADGVRKHMEYHSAPSPLHVNFGKMIFTRK